MTNDLVVYFIDQALMYTSAFQKVKYKINKALAIHTDVNSFVDNYCAVYVCLIMNMTSFYNNKAVSNIKLVL